MSGTGRRLTASEHHLGDRLAALIDGELSHESRERVLAHLATCWSCKAEADAQRRVKSVFADVAPPAPSAGFLARLQGLPGGAGLDSDDDTPASRRPAPGEGVKRRRDDVLHRPALPWEVRGLSDQGLLSPRGFRIHEMERPGSRGRRFAFAAAGAVSLAALALSGALTTEISGGVATPPADRSAHPAGSVRAAAEQGGASGEAPGADQQKRPFGGQSPATTSPVRPDGFTSPLRSAMVLAPPLIAPLAPTWSQVSSGSPLTGGSPGENRPGASPPVAPSGAQPLAGRAPQTTPSATGPAGSR